MKRKICVLFFLVICTVLSVSTLSACESNIGALQTDKKYIAEGDTKDPENEQRYYIFYSDGTGKYIEYDVDSNTAFSYYDTDYTITFKYTYADDDKTAVVCFYDSVTYGSKQGGEYRVPTTWSVLLTVSKNVLCTTGGSFYINEDYLETIPNFGK